MQHLKKISLLCFVISLVLPSQILAATTSLQPKFQYLFPRFEITDLNVSATSGTQTLKGSFSISTKENFASYGINYAVTLIGDSNLPSFKQVVKSSVTIIPGMPQAITFSLPVPAYIATGKYRVAVGILSNSGEEFSSSIAPDEVQLTGANNELLLDPSSLEISRQGVQTTPSMTSALDSNSVASLKATLLAGAPAAMSVIPALAVYSSVHPDLLPPVQTVYGTPLTTTPGVLPTVSVDLPTTSNGVFYGKLTLVDANHSPLSNAVEVPWQVGNSSTSFEAALISSRVTQFGPLLRVQATAVVNQYLTKPSGITSQVVFSLKRSDGSTLVSKKVSYNSSSGTVEVPVTLSALTNADARDFTLSAVASGQTIESQVPTVPSHWGVFDLSGYLLVLLAVLFQLLRWKKFNGRSLGRHALVVGIAVSTLLLVGSKPFAGRAFAADDHGITNTTFTPATGTNLGKFPVCGDPNGTIYPNSAGCKIKVTGSLAFDSQYLSDANGGFSSLSYRYLTIDTEVLVNGIPAADPFDSDANRTVLTDSDGSGDKRNFSLTFTTHFVGTYQIKVIPHYYYYFNSCHGLFNDSCTHEHWFSDEADYTATVVPVSPWINLPPTIQVPSGTTSTSLNWSVSQIVPSFNLRDVTGANGYPVTIPVGSTGGGTTVIPVTRTPTQTLQATATANQAVPNQKSSTLFVDPLPLRQGDYKELSYTIPVNDALPDLAWLMNPGSTPVKHQPTFYPGDTLDYAHAVGVVTLQGCNLGISKGCLPYSVMDVYIPVSRFGTVNGAPDDSLVQACSYSSHSSKFDPTLGTCSPTHQPVMNAGDTLLPALISNMTQSSKFDQKSCIGLSSRSANCIVFTTNYTSTQTVIRNYAGRTRYLFHVTNTTQSAFSTTVISTGGAITPPCISNCASASTPTASLVVLPASLTQVLNSPFTLSLTATNSQSSYITRSGVSGTIATSCMNNLTSVGGTCYDVPPQVGTYIYTGYACAGADRTTGCVPSASESVTVTNGSCLSNCTVPPLFAYNLAPVSVVSGGSYTLTASPVLAGLTATAVSFQCAADPTLHQGTLGTNGFYSYSGCTAPVVTTSDKIYQAAAYATLAGSPDSNPTTSVTVTLSQSTTPAVSTSSSYFCTGD